MASKYINDINACLDQALRESNEELISHFQHVLALAEDQGELAAQEWDEAQS